MILLIFYAYYDHYNLANYSFFLTDGSFSVQLVPGTEVAVAPKRRERNLNAKKGSDASVKECSNVKIMLRVQETTRSAFHEADIKGFDVRVALTTIAYIHPETAEKFSLESLQMVSVSPRKPLKGSMKKDEALNKKNSEASKVVENDTRSSKKEPRRAILRLVISDLTAKGHLMMVESLRLYLGAGLHSCEYFLTYRRFFFMYV